LGGRLGALFRGLSPQKPPRGEGTVGHIVRITTGFVQAIDEKFGPPSENYSSPLLSKAGYRFSGDCCLVTSVSYATQLSLFTIKIFRFDIIFE